MQKLNVLAAIMIVCMCSCSLFFAGCKTNTTPERIDLIETTRNGIGWELAEYGDWLNHGEFYFVCRASRPNGNDAEIFRPYDNAYTEGQTYYLFFFDSDITSIKVNGIEEFNNSKFFTKQQIKDLYYIPSSDDYIYNDLLNSNEVTGNIKDQEERGFPVSMTKHENVRVLPFIYNKNINIKIS